MNSDEVDAICKHCKCIIFKYPLKFKKLSDKDFCCLTCYLKN